LDIMSTARVRLPASDTQVDLVSMEQLLAWLGEHAPRKRLLLGHNLHSMYVCETSVRFRAMYGRADLVLPDGFPVWVMAKFLARRRVVGGDRLSAPRIGSTDWLARLDQVGRPLRVAVLGATAASNRDAVQRLGSDFPSHEFTGWDGYAGRTALESNGFIELTSFNPDIVLIGMGMPAQEEWLHEHWNSLPVATYAVVGGAIDQVSGEQVLAPRWLGPLGLEWAWRLIADPRRLAGRYLVEPLKLGYRLLAKRSPVTGP
jgi:N-acetylglucosaminyldiphosphoundecaprenol N-acetyl-beta-D-mannosaminyltransferase